MCFEGRQCVRLESEIVFVKETKSATYFIAESAGDFRCKERDDSPP
jgi:hypothetical protein